VAFAVPGFWRGAFRLTRFQQQRRPMRRAIPGITPTPSRGTTSPSSSWTCHCHGSFDASHTAAPRANSMELKRENQGTSV
jgi:hypothetical protein